MAKFLDRFGLPLMPLNASKVILSMLVKSNTTSVGSAVSMEKVFVPPRRCRPSARGDVQVVVQAAVKLPFTTLKSRALSIVPIWAKPLKATHSPGVVPLT